MFSELPLYNKLLVAIIDILAIWLGVMVLNKNSIKGLNKSFLFILISMLFWVNFAFLARMLDQSTDHIYVILSLKTAWFATPFLFVFLYHFVIYFLEIPKKHLALNYFVTIGGSLIALLVALTNFVVKDIAYVNNSLTIVYGPGMYAYIGVGILLMLAPIYVIFKRYFALNDNIKRKVKIILIGTFSFYLLNLIFNVILPTSFDITRYYFFGDYSSLILLAAVAYSIVRFKAFDIKVATTEATVMILSIFLFAEIFLSNGTLEYLSKSLIWVLVSYVGYKLVGSIKKEINQREEIEKLASNLKKANKELKELDQAKDDFLSMASHELNTPLSAIEGYLSMMLDEEIGGKLNKTHRGYLEKVFKSSQRLAHLVKDLLNVSRIEQGRIHLIYVQANLNDVVEQAYAEIKPIADKFKHTVTLNLDKDIPKSYFDADRITEVVINLVGNAFKYTPAKGSIEIKTYEKDKSITFSVTDNGNGIAKEYLGSIFEKFERGGMVHDQGRGTGLGLFISKNLVDIHEGNIWVESRGEGKGSTFYFSLPILTQKPHDKHEGEGPVLRLK